MRSLVTCVGVCITAGGLILVPAVRSDAQQAFAPGSREVQVEIRSPEPGGLVRGRFDMIELAGLARTGAREAVFDVMLVIDVSGSALYPSGIDIDGDGVLGITKKSLVPGFGGTKNTDPEDSILAAELMAARRMLETLDPNRVRIGVVSFSGEANPITYRRRSPDQADALLEQPLTQDYTQVEAALSAIGLRGASGGTNMEAGVKLAVQELAGLTGALSQPQADAQKVILMLTDGRPSLPFGTVTEEDPEDTEATIAAARLAAQAGIKINVFGLGPGAISYPLAVTEVSKATGGLYTPVQRPGDVVALLTGVSFANVDDVVAVNLTMGQMSGPNDVAVLPDGSFKGFVPVQPGVNRIRVSALASDGTRGSEEFDVQFVPQELSNNELGEELERVRQRNRDIQILTERRRQDAFREAERARALTLEVEGGDGKGKPGTPPAGSSAPAPKQPGAARPPKAPAAAPKPAPAPAPKTEPGPVPEPVAPKPEPTP
jgi:hypothetical protein